MKSTSPAGMRAGLLAIFVLSGFAGLIYQSIWSHYLGLFLGHAAYAQALVLAIFMGGMAVGAAWIARAGQRWRNLIRGYAIVEAVIGVLGLLFHTLFTSVAAFSYDALIPALSEPWTVNLARWLIAAALISPQTILLGMTFPLMSGGLIRRVSGSDGHILGGLYFTNSIGAAIGALVAVFVLLPSIGLPGAMGIAGVLNFVVAGLAWWLAREPEPEISTGQRPVDEYAQQLAKNPLLRAVLLATAVSGAASFAYEIIWIRMLSMAVGTTMHAFELMLASFIAGIALGGLWVRKHADITPSPLRLAGWMQIFMGIAALGSLMVYANSFAWVEWLLGALTKTDGGYNLFNFGTASIAIIIMLPAAFFAGTTLPLFTVTLLRAGLGERAIGRVYAWNTLGSIAGVVLAIHFLIPTLGLKFSLCVAALADLAVGLVLLRGQATKREDFLPLGVAALLSACTVAFAIRAPFDPGRLTSGVFRHGNSTAAADSRVIFLRDGKTATVSVTSHNSGAVVIATNGKPDAGIMMIPKGEPSADEPTMILAGALPLAMHVNPQRVGVIGFGSGLTTHTLLSDPRIQRVDTVEIESAMVLGARAFGERVRRAYDDPRSNIVIDDAKSYFSSQRFKYDVLISEPSNPWINGVGSLYTKEFYRQIYKNLNPEGLFVQWIHLYEIDEQLIGTVINALSPEFEDYSLWITNYSDLLIIAKPKGVLPEPNFNSVLSGILGGELKRLGIQSAEHLNFHKMGDARVVRAIGRLYDKFPVNSDYLPVLSLHAPRARFKGASAHRIRAISDEGPPLLEALSLRRPLPEGERLSSHRIFMPEINTRLALALNSALKGVAPGESALREFSADELTLPVLLRNSAPSCGREWTKTQRSMFSQYLRATADKTISFLPPSVMEGTWISPAWVSCSSGLPLDYRKALGLIEAVALRDYSAMERLGKEWLDAPPTDAKLRQEFDQVALSHMLLATARRQDWRELLAIEESYGERVESTGVYMLQRTLLKAMAHE
nr:fused MFS/spermidine synthase [uncultured Acidovorax sp.]